MKACHAAPLRTPTTPSPRYPEPQPVSGLRRAIEEAQQADAASKNPAGLLPCPFCGSFSLRLVKGLTNVSCDHCAAEGPFSSCPKEARLGWNNRVVFIVPTTAANPRLAELLKRASAVVAEQFDIVLESLLGKRRFRSVAEPRMALYLLLRENTKASLDEIGELLHKDHGTISRGLSKARALLDIDAAYAARVARCRAILQEVASAELRVPSGAAPSGKS